MDSIQPNDKSKRKNNVWKRLKTTLRVSKKKSGRDKNRMKLESIPSNSISSTDNRRYSASFDPLLELSVASSSSSYLPRTNPTGKPGLKRELSISEEDKIVLLQYHTTDRDVSPALNVKDSSKELQKDNYQSHSTDGLHSENSKHKENSSKLWFESKNPILVLEQCVFQHSIDTSVQSNEVMELEQDLHRAMTEIESQANEVVVLKGKQKELSQLVKTARDELKVVKTVKDTLRILEADAAESKLRSKELEDRIVGQRFILDQLKATRDSTEQVLSDLRTQSGKLRKALREKNRPLLDNLDILSESRYREGDIRKLEAAVEVLTERMSQVRAQAKSDHSPNHRKRKSYKSRNLASPKPTSMKNSYKSDASQSSPSGKSKIRSELELKKREAFDIKLKFFEKEMEVSKLVAILEDEDQDAQIKSCRNMGKNSEASNVQCFSSKSISQVMSNHSSEAFPSKFSPRKEYQSSSRDTKVQVRSPRPRSVSMRLGTESSRKGISSTKKKDTAQRWK